MSVEKNVSVLVKFRCISYVRSDESTFEIFGIAKKLE